MWTNKAFSLTKKKALVVGTGLVALDIVIGCEKGQQPMLWAGGTCGNVLTILSYLGWDATLISRLNSNSISKHIKKDLKKWGVDLSLINIKPTMPAPIILERIYTDSEGVPTHKFKITCPNCRSRYPSYVPVPAKSLDRVFSKKLTPKVFFFDRVSRGAIGLAQEYSKKGSIIYFEPSANSSDKLLVEALQVSHIVKCSHDRGSQLRQHIEKHMPLLEIETEGSSGLRFRGTMFRGNRFSWKRNKSFNVLNLRDSAGSGDWFTAGIIFKLCQKGMKCFSGLKQQQIESAFTFGQSLAAWNCSFEGPRGGMYSTGKQGFRKQILQILNKKSPTPYQKNEISGELTKLLEDICPTCIT